MQNRVENDHERFRALQRKAFLPDVAGVQKHLERFRFQKQPKQRDLDLRSRRGAFAGRDSSRCRTQLRMRGFWMCMKFRADGVGIDLLERRDHFAQRHLACRRGKISMKPA